MIVGLIQNKLWKEVAGVSHKHCIYDIVVSRTFVKPTQKVPTFPVHQYEVAGCVVMRPVVHGDINKLTGLLGQKAAGRSMHRENVTGFIDIMPVGSNQRILRHMLYSLKHSDGQDIVRSGNEYKVAFDPSDADIFSGVLKEGSSDGIMNRIMQPFWHFDNSDIGIRPLNCVL